MTSSSQIKSLRMKFNLIAALVFGMAFLAKAQEINPALTILTDAFKRGVTDFPKNKVFIKTDKDIYYPGERIWFKAEIFNCLTESYSGEPELIVMLKGEKGEVITDNKYLTINGTCDNELIIPSWASEGNAFLVAFTPKALNANDVSLAAIKPIKINSLKRNNYLFDLTLNKKVYKPGEDAKLSIRLTSVRSGIKREKMLVSLYDYNQKILSERVTVTVDEINELKFKLPEKVSNGLFFELSYAGKNNTTQKLPVYTSADNIRIEFYPEGGTLMTNNLQRILYRATDPFGEPIDVSGNVYDQLENHVGIGKIIKKGYGLINLMPMPNQKYYFKIEDEYGKDLEFELPEAQIDGSCFTLLKTEDSTLRVSVLTTGKYIGDKLTLAAIGGGKILMTTEIEGTKKNNLKIGTNLFPFGIINFVILSSTGKILSERLVYNTPNQDINIDIETNLKPSEKNGEVEISIDLSKFIEQFGKSKIDVCIADKFNLFNSDQAEIETFLKYPLQTPVPKTVLDIYLTNLELIANEYKHYNLNSLLTSTENIKQEPGKNFSGIVTDKNRRGVPNATVMALQSNNLALATTTTDEKGHFVFDRISNSKDVIVKAFSSTGKKTYTVHVNRSFDESLEEIILLESFRSTPPFNRNELITYIQQNKDLLKLIGTENKDTKPVKKSNAEKLLESGTSVLDVIKMTKPFRLEGNQIVFYGSNNSFYFQSGALIVIDGQKMGTDASVLNSLSPFDIKSINISTNPVDIQRFTGLNSVGIIEIKTKNKSEDFMPEQKESDFHEMETFNADNIPHNVWKYQTTLLWKNDIPIDESGKVKLKLLLSEISSDFVVQVDAISEGGIKHHETTTFSTKKFGSY
jgi:hypothetical protein